MARATMPGKMADRMISSQTSALSAVVQPRHRRKIMPFLILAGAAIRLKDVRASFLYAKSERPGLRENCGTPAV
jgi:hypothetical protein